uniref:Retrotransposon gag domain-containing protein n=1 Tax=Hucho hucho TaxID=62062 RepID=A0A4W5NCV1_9TELE
MPVPGLRFALSLLLCLLAIDPVCTTKIVIKLQMDPHSPGASLQKTSPTHDPAALVQMSTEISTQANQLAIHQQQLTHLTTVTEELVRTLQRLQVSLTNPAPPQPNASVGASPPPSLTVNPRLALPDKFDGNPTKSKGFLLQCSLFIDQQPAMYVTDASKISLVCSLLTGKALEWVTAVWREDGTAFPSFGTFLQRFREIFEHPEGGMRADDRLLALSQGRNTAAEYALTFRTLAAQTDWVESTLKLLFRKGLSLELQSELACRDEGRSLNQFIELTIQIDNLIRSRRPLR